jgi:hypothetical protein
MPGIDSTFAACKRLRKRSVISIAAAMPLLGCTARVIATVVDTAHAELSRFARRGEVLTPFVCSINDVGSVGIEWRPHLP